MKRKLDTIAERLFDFQYEFLYGLANGEIDLNTLPVALQNELAAEDIQRKLQWIRATLAQDDVSEVSGEVRTPVDLPQHIIVLARNKQAAQQAARKAAGPGNSRFWISGGAAPGMVYRVAPVSIGVATDSPLVNLRAPITVVLNCPQEDVDGNPIASLWRGWTASADTDFATWWDVLPDSTVDSPLNPEHAMIHAWNPINVQVKPGIDQPIGLLDPEQLHAVRLVTAEFLAGQEPDGLSILGFVGKRTLIDQQTLAMTGTALSGQDDPRRLFQKLYREISLELKELVIEYMDSVARKNATNEVVIPSENARPAWWFVDSLRLKWIDEDADQTAPASADFSNKKGDRQSPEHTIATIIHIGGTSDGDIVELTCESHRDAPGLVNLIASIAQPKLLQLADRLDLRFLLEDGAALTSEITLTDDRKGGLFGLSRLKIEWSALFSFSEGVRVEVGLVPRN